MHAPMRIVLYLLLCFTAGDPHRNPINEFYRKEHLSDGEHISYYSSGEISEKCSTLNGNLHGELISYYPGGMVRERDHFDHGLMIDSNFK